MTIRRIHIRLRGKAYCQTDSTTYATRAAYRTMRDSTAWALHIVFCQFCVYQHNREEEEHTREAMLKELKK
jgi:hypothetical protein